jgi:GNAT superfamily N-acetyltransferase
LFVDKKHRGQGIARAALEGALGQIARLGGGLVEAITEVTAGRQAQGRSSSARQPSFSSRTASPASARSANTPGS